MALEYKSEYKQVVLEIFLSFGITRVVVNGTHPLIKLPEYLLENPEVHLDLSYNLGINFPMSLDDDGIRAVLSFNKTPFSCFIPWDALWLVATQDSSELRVIIFPESVPPSIQRQVDVARRRASFKVIEGGTEEEISTPRTGHLRLVQ